MPQIPMLAPQLKEDPFVLRHALCEELDRQGVDPDTVAAIDFNKAERNTWIGYSLNRLRHVLVDGIGPDSVFRDFRPTPSRLHHERAFREHLSSMHVRAARKVQDFYTHGQDPEHRWWPLAEQRYNQLGALAVVINPKPIPPEGQTMEGGLRSKALSHLGTAMLVLVKRRMPGIEPDVRAQAAHDVVPFWTSFAGLHMDHFRRISLGRVDVSMERADSGLYVVRQTPGSRGEIHRVKTDPASNATMKCTMHTRLIVDDEFGFASGYSKDIKPETNLQTIMHAIINAGDMHGFFEEREGEPYEGDGPFVFKERS